MASFLRVALAGGDPLVLPVRQIRSDDASAKLLITSPY
jgi:hypothetical protein